MQFGRQNNVLKHFKLQLGFQTASSKLKLLSIFSNVLILFSGCLSSEPLVPRT